ncbi:hypothetical protein CFK39_10650 [Brachybacterium avium]|uniref:Proteinase inhibitor I42 chagasin domain-containing protein n=1 Tax=Brachybacterium avium TaxID=2017485 RepID=A0A220UDJ5_9MICO|nr:hypothetical protein [Brachybacterium avium]ASK66197.1 hypothetical protein CFK39_10650 [Brachybacterium avium]
MTRPGATVSRRARLARRGRVLLAATGAVLLSGCSLLPVGEDPSTEPSDQATTTQAAPSEGTLLPEGTAAVEVTAGEIVQVSLPEGSLGVGDYWGVVSMGDPAIVEADVAIGEKVFGVEPASDSTQAPGSTQQFAVEIHGLAAGETTVRVLYCTRTREVEEDCDQSHGTLEAPVEPVEISVRVA